jgi:prephenate dehydrogenase
MWAEILLDNRESMLTGIRDLQKELQILTLALEQNDRVAVEQFLSEAATLRSRTPL